MNGRGVVNELLLCVCAAAILGSSCHPEAKAPTADVAEAPPAAPAPLPERAKLALAELSPPVARPADAPDAETLPERAVDPAKQAEEELEKGNYFKARELLERARGFAPNSPRVQRGLGLALAGLGDRAKAEPNLRKSTTEAPDHVRVQLLLGQYATMQSKFDEAIVRFRTAVVCSDATDDNPDTAEALVRLGAALEKQGYWSASLECYRRFHQLITTYGRAFAGRPLLRSLLTQPEQYMVAEGRLLVKLRRPEEAAGVLERAYRRDKTHPEAGPLAVRSLAAAGRFDQAEAIVMEMLDEPTQRRQAISLIGELCRARKDPDAPARLLQVHLSRGGKDSAFVIAMAEIAAGMGRPEAAAEMLSRHLTSTPENGRVILRLARLHFRTGDVTAGATQLARLLAMDVPESSQVFQEVRLLAKAEAREGRIEKIAGSAETAPADMKPALLSLAGMLADATGDRPRAMKLLRRAIEADAQFWPAYEALDRMHVAEGDFEAVQALARQADQAAGDSHFALYLSGRSQLERGRIEQAVAKLEAARDRKGNHVPTLLSLGRAYVLQARLREAESALTAALGLAPDNVEVVREAFEFYLLRGRRAEAYRLLTRFLQSNPKDVPARVLLARYFLLVNQIDRARKLSAALTAEAPDDPAVGLLELSFELPRSLAGDPIPAKKAEAVLKKLRGILGLDPRNASAARLYAALLVNQKRYVEAADALEGVHRRMPYDVLVANAYLSALIEGKAEERAAQAIDRIAEGKPTRWPMRSTLVDKLIRIKRYPRAAALLEAWMSEPADEADLRRLRLKALQVYEAAGSHDKAHQLLDSWIASGPQEAVLRLLRQQKLRTYAQAKQYDEAIAYAKKWLRNQPKNDQPRRALLAVLVEAEAYDKAHAVADEWIAEVGKDAARQPKGTKLMVYGLEGKFDRVLGFGRKWIAEDPDFAGANHLLIAVLMKHEKHDQAFEVAKEWLQRREKVAASAPAKGAPLLAPQRAVVEVLSLAKRKREALTWARKFAKAAPEDVGAMRLLYAALALNEKHDEAVALLEKMHKLDPDDPGVNNDLGYSWADRGIKLQEAERMVRKALAERPQEIAFKDSLAWVLYKQGRFAEAKTLFDQVVASPAERLHAVILDHAGDTCWRLGLAEEAIRLWRRAVEMAKDGEREDRDTKRVLAKTPAKINAARRGRKPKIAPLGAGVP